MSKFKVKYDRENQPTFSFHDVTPTEMGQKVEAVRVSIYYTKGGNSAFTSKTQRRGVYVSITPITRERTEYGFADMQSLFGDVQTSGFKVLVLEMKKFSEKKLTSVAVLCEDSVEEWCQKFRVGAPHANLAIQEWRDSLGMADQKVGL